MRAWQAMRAWPAAIIILALPALLLLAPPALASQEAEDLFGRETLTVDLTVSSELGLRPKDTREDMSVDYVQADLFFYPKEDTAQRVASLFTSPQAERRDSALRFRWEQPDRDLAYKAQSRVEVRNHFPRVLKKIPFPLTKVPAEARRYLEPSKHIDSTNPAIVNLANKLAQGKDDLFVVVSEIAIWTKNNIEYNLSTLTAEVTQKASWVLQNKYGVCDELTSLFIAMLRALGIPARFVTGVSYTTSPLFPQRWGAHGWAEVYFPDVGWVPFDPTFGEFGWVDPGHVKMMTSLDPAEPSVRFEWRGTNADLTFSEPGIDASITRVGSRLPPIVALAVEPLYDETGFGSHNLVQATIENLQPYYLTTEVRLARVNELEVLEPHDRQIILRPREKKSVFWRVKVADSLEERYVYTIPLGVYTIMNDSALATFTARAQGGQHTKQEVTRAMNALAEEEEQVVARNLSLECSADTEVLYPGETATVRCALRNAGTTPLKSVRACLEDQQCKTFDIGIGQTRELTFTQGFTQPGSATLFVRASTAELSKSAPVAFQMRDEPAINITGIIIPASVSYGRPFSVVFVLEPVSHSTPQDVEVRVRTNIATKVFEIPELPGDQAFEVEMHADDLSRGDTPISIEVSYKDARGKEYRSRARASTTLTDVPFFARLWLWFRSIFE